MQLIISHAEAIRIFRATVELEKVIINITCNTVQDTYYKERINPHISTATDRLSVFLLWLFTMYGDIDRDTIKEEEKRSSR